MKSRAFFSPNSVLAIGTLSLLTLLLLYLPVRAHNGAVAIAVPVKGITIDGDFSDWPEGMRRYPIELPEYGVPARDQEDFQADFRVGFNEPENALYVALDVHDESTVIDTSADAAWNTQDGCEIHVALWGEERALETSGYRSFSPGPEWQDVDFQARRTDNRQLYEWRIDISRSSSGRVELAAGMFLGLRVAVEDKDADGSFSWMAWDPGISKDMKSIGDLILADSYAALATISGTVVAGQDQKPYDGLLLWAFSEDRPVSSARTDARGSYHMELPAGEYILEPGSRQPVEPFSVDIPSLLSGEETRVDLIVRPMTFRFETSSESAVLGTTVPAGPGTGHWKTYDMTDGLADGYVWEVLQDREGYLWFATKNGLSRYDGLTFRTFTARDGLADEQTVSLFQDSKGNLWVTTPSALSRYDGRVFTTFTKEDGLLQHNISSIFEDQRGDLWFAHGDRGLSRYDGRSFSHFTTQLLRGRITDISQDLQGNLWVVTEEGVSRYDGERFLSYSAQDSLIADDLWSRLPGGGIKSNCGFATDVDTLSPRSTKKISIFVAFSTASGLP